MPLTQRHPVYCRGARSSLITIDDANTQHIAGTHIYQTNPVQIISNSSESGTNLITTARGQKMKLGSYIWGWNSRNHLASCSPRFHQGDAPWREPLEHYTVGQWESSHPEDAVPSLPSKTSTAVWMRTICDIYTEIKIYIHARAFRLFPSVKAICLSSSKSQKTVTEK